MTWIVLSFIAAMSSAFFLLAQEKFQVPVISTLMLSRLMAFLLTLPVLYFVDLPTNPIYYIAVLGTAIIFSYVDFAFINATSKFGAGIPSRLNPTINIALFFLWLFFNPALLVGYIQNPTQLILIVTSIFGATIFGLAMRRDPINNEAIKALFIPIILGALGLSLSKYALDHSDLHSGVFTYIMMQSICMFFIYLIYSMSFNREQNFRHFKQSRVYWIAMIFAACTIVHLTSKNYAFSLTVHPVYVNTIVMTTPFWVMVYYILIKQREKAPLLPSLGLLFCAFVMVFALQI